VPRPHRKTWTVEDYDRAAEKYVRRLPLEHFMEAIPQSTQRLITTSSFNQLQASRPRLQVFNELLVQYFHRGRLRQVVPDNMLRECDVPPVTGSSFNTELEPVQPFWVLEYVSPQSHRKDYHVSFKKYERHLKVPYCLMFYPDVQELRFHRHNGKQYQPIPLNAEGRYPVPELEVEVGLLDMWVRFWYRGELLELPADLRRQAKEATRLAEQERQRADEATRLAEQQQQRAEAAEAAVARLQALLAQLNPPPG
jgi:Uma2 family endonuclease